MGVIQLITSLFKGLTPGRGNAAEVVKEVVRRDDGKEVTISRNGDIQIKGMSSSDITALSPALETLMRAAKTIQLASDESTVSKQLKS